MGPLKWRVVSQFLAKYSRTPYYHATDDRTSLASIPKVGLQFLNPAQFLNRESVKHACVPVKSCGDVLRKPKPGL